jgi:LemA protein
VNVWVIVVLAVLVALLLFVVFTYNRLVRKRNRVQESWAQIDVQLRRRHDLIPNLVEAVRGYAAHERGTFEAVVRARAAAVSATERGNANEIGTAESALTQTLRSLLAVVENYPQLQASENFLALQEQLVSTEDKIAFARQYYNGAVRDLNTSVQTFPVNVVARGFGFRMAEYFEADDSVRAAPAVQFPPPSG